MFINLSATFQISNSSSLTSITRTRTRPDIFDTISALARGVHNSTDRRIRAVTGPKIHCRDSKHRNRIQPRKRSIDQELLRHPLGKQQRKWEVVHANTPYDEPLLCFVKK